MRHAAAWDLAVVETDAEVRIVVDGDRDDWVIAFTKNGAFPARAWAEQVVAIVEHRQIESRSTHRKPGRETDAA